MKKTVCFILMVCLALSLSAFGESYKVYESSGNGIFLTKAPGTLGWENVIISLSRGDKALGIFEKGDSMFVYTESGLCGYVYKDVLIDTGKTFEIELSEEELTIKSRQEAGIFLLSADEKAELPTETGVYPKSVTIGENTHDVQKLLSLLLGDTYTQRERNEWSDSTEYVGNANVNPWETRTVHVSDDGEIWFYDPSVSGERGGEYEPPRMNMLPDDSVLIAKGLLAPYFTNGETEHVGKSRLISERWSYSDRWMTDAEYREFMYNRDLHYFVFEHRTEADLSILGDNISASVGVNGLNGFTLNWHEYTQSAEEIAPMPLEDAIRMADSTRAAKATLLYAELVYSNWLTETNEYNLSWYLVTDAGSYVVDCVLGAHKCDSYEY